MQRRRRWNCEAEKENQNKQKNSEASFPDQKATQQRLRKPNAAKNRFRPKSSRDSV